MSNITTAVFKDRPYTTVYGIYQWAYGQILRIQGLRLPPAVEIDFSTQETGGSSTTRIGVTQDGVTDVPIPESILENGGATRDYTAYAFIVLTDETSGQTEYKICMHITARPKPEVTKNPEDADLFREAISAVNQSAMDAKAAEKSAEAWAHGHEDYPERDEDNAAYYAGQAAIIANGLKDNVKDMVDQAQTARNTAIENANIAVNKANKTETDRAEVEQYKSQAAQSATNALLSEQNAKTSETAAQESQAGAEAAEGQAELFAAQTEEDKNTVEQAKAVVMEIGQEVAENKNAVEQAVDSFELLRQQAVADVNNAGQTQTERVEEAGEQSVNDINAAGIAQKNAVNEAAQQALQNIGSGVDSTLSQEGKAADAGVTGKAIDELKGDLDDLAYGHEASMTVVDTNTGIDNFATTRVTGGLRANMFPPTKGVTSIEVVVSKLCSISVGTVDISTNQTTEIIPKANHDAGKHKFILPNPIDTTDTVKIYVNVDSGILSTNKNGVGMFDSKDNRQYDGWELSYSLLVESPKSEGIIKDISDLGSKVSELEEQTSSIPYITQQVENIDDRVSELENKVELPIKYGEIIIPSQIHVAVGRQCNLWWDSIAYYNRGDKSVYFECESDIGGVFENCFRINPTSSDIGNHNLRIVSRYGDTRKIISDVTCVINVVSTSTESGNVKNILMMGDSRTWQSFRGSNGTGYARTGYGDKDITTEVLALCNADDGYNISCIGSEVSTLDTNVKNLAKSGQTYRYPTRIFNENGGVVSYCESNGLNVGETLDIATIMFGVNDLMNGWTQKIGFYDDCVGRIDGIINNAKSLINAISSAYENCKIVLVIEPTTCASQDGSPNLSSNFSRISLMELETAMKVLRKYVINTFDNNKYSNNVVLSSAGIWCDRMYGFPYDMISVSDRTSVKKEMWANNVHPHTDGYRQISDGIYSTIKALY